MAKHLLFLFLTFLFIGYTNANGKIDSLKLSLDTAQTNRSKAVIYINIAVFFFGNGDVDSAIHYNEIGIPYALKSKVDSTYQHIRANQTSYLIKKGNFNPALKILRQLQTEKPLPSTLQTVHDSYGFYYISLVLFRRKKQQTQKLVVMMAVDVTKVV